MPFWVSKVKESIFTYIVQQANKQNQLDSDVGTRISSTLLNGVSGWGVTIPAHLCSGDLQKQDEEVYWRPVPAGGRSGEGFCTWPNLNL